MDELLRLGKESRLQGNCNAGIIHFQKALQINMNSLEAKLGYAQCSKQLGSFSDAKKAFGDILKRDPKFFDAVIGLSEIDLEENAPDKVEKRLEPLLTEFPNHTGLRILEARLLGKNGKRELAIYKLKALSEKLSRPADVEKMLSELYIETQKWKEAEESLNHYVSKAPSDPSGFTLLAKLNLYRTYFSVPDLLAILPNAEEYLQNALNLNPKEESARLLLVHLKMIEAYQNRSKNTMVLEKAFRNIYELAREFPENQYYHSLEASLADDLDRSRFAEFHFRRTLQLDDLDEITRFEAEEYAIRQLKEESKFRRELGDYRKERFHAEKRSLYYKSAVFHLLRAKDLIPGNVRQELLESYDTSGNLIDYINLLIKLRDEDPNHFKLQNKLEFAIQSLKSSLEYKEGLISLEPKGVILNRVSVSPEIFVFDLESRVPFPEHYPGGRLLAKALRYELKKVFDVRLPEESEFQLIRNSLQETNFHPFTKTIPFSIESLYQLDQLRRNKTKIRYVLHGNYSFHDDVIDLEISLYDRNTSKDIGKWKTSQKGRDGLSVLCARISEKVKQLLPIEGKIYRIKDSEVLVSLGKKDGIRSDAKILFQRKGKDLMEGEITELGMEISRVRPLQRGWEKELATGDFVTVRPKVEVSP
ncbi:tetratricopeptide repeat protein [Leptospira ryugenii]|nr:tetratricopeptide repeat protein [Leptospira ryugenii]